MTNKELNKVQNEVKKASEKTLTRAGKAWCNLFKSGKEINDILKDNDIKVDKAIVPALVALAKDKEVVIVQSGIGKVNMALCTQILADRFDVKAVINTGVAGGLYKDIEIGDIVISKDAVQHDVDATVFGYKVGEIPRMDTSYFEADKDLIELAKKTCDEVNPDIHSYVGRVVSGDQFISDNKKKHYLINEFDGYCAEMEGAAMAQAAHLNQIPFIILRAISDKADQEAAGSYEEFEKAAIKHIVRLVLGILDRM